MPDVLIRGLDPDVIERLKRHASDGHRSLQAEIRFILTQRSEQPSQKEMVENLRKFRNSLKTQRTNSVDLIREDRDDPSR